MEWSNIAYICKGHNEIQAPVSNLHMSGAVS